MKRRSDGRWQKQITLPNGKKKSLYSTAASERLAVKEFNDYLLRFTKEQEKSDLFESIAEEWKEVAFPELENNTLKQYRPCYDAAIQYFKGMKVADIMPYHIHEYIDFLKKKDYAQKTIKNRILLVSLILGYAARYNKITHNPCADVKLKTPKGKNKRQKASDEDEQKIKSYKEGDFGVLAYLFLVTGCRRGEACALTPKDVFPTHIHIDKTVEWIGSTPQIKPCPKTEAGERDIPITAELYNLLQPYMKNNYIFESESGKPLSNGVFSRKWKTLRNKTGISCSPHELRHSYATILFDAGIDIKTAQRWLGHKDINTTLAIYTHLSETALIKNTDKIKEYIATNF